VYCLRVEILVASSFAYIQSTPSTPSTVFGAFAPFGKNRIIGPEQEPIYTCAQKAPPGIPGLPIKIGVDYTSSTFGPTEYPE
jgi:hypothetical protein